MSALLDYDAAITLLTANGMNPGDAKTLLLRAACNGETYASPVYLKYQQDVSTTDGSVDAHGWFLIRYA
jgi:hypothetical protein